MDTDRPTDSGTLRTAVGTMRAQEAKGRSKYGADLDGAGLDALQLLTHATEEAADLLMYLTALQKAVAELRTSARCEYERFKDSVGQVAPLRARVAELEAEVSATERTADEERDRAKRAERLLESESARVADLEAQLQAQYERHVAATVEYERLMMEMEASVAYEHNRFKRRGGELDRLDARVAELERSLSSTETHRQALAHELSRAQQLDEASIKTIARKDRRIEELEHEVMRLRALNPLGWQIPGTDGAGLGPVMVEWQTSGTGSGDLSGQGIQPTTRPLTTADREAVRGDVVRHKIYGYLNCVGPGNFLPASSGGAVNIATLETMPYVSRADGGPVTVEGAGGG